MLDHPYLVAIALIEQGHKRKMPLGGKSSTKYIDKHTDQVDIDESLIAHLLIRVFQQSNESPIRRYYEDKSLLLIQIKMDKMQEQIPLIKSEWIERGDTQKLIVKLKGICEGVWQVLFTREEGIQYKPI